MSTKPIIQFFKFQGEITKYRCLCTDHLSFRLDSRIEEYNPNLIFGTGRAAPGQGQNNEQSTVALMTHSSACVALLNLMV